MAFVYLNQVHMKALSFLLLALIILSCNEDSQDKGFIFSGQIDKIDKNSVVVTHNADPTLADTIEIDYNGRFLDTLKLPNGLYSFSDGKNTNSIYLTKGKELQIKYEVSDNNDSVQFSGSAAPINVFLHEKSLLIDKFFEKRRPLYELKPSEFNNKISKLQESIQNLLETSEGISNEFIELEKNNLKYYRLVQLNGYKNTVSNKGDEFQIPDGFLSGIDSLDFNREKDFNYSYSYRNLFYSHYQKKAFEMRRNDSIDGYLASLKIIESHPNQNIKNLYLFSTVRSGIKYVNDFESYFNSYSELSNNDRHKKYLGKSYNDRKKVAPGQPSPEFQDYENYAGGTTSLKDFRGKFVYIDVWATWCGPCRYEIPYLKELEKEYHDKNIQFVSISVDTERSINLWRTTIEKDNLGGVQLLAPNDFKSKFVQDYLITGIPRFILIDPEGKIVSYNAPRPSDKKLIDLFEAHGV